jgi:hypothetical protein
LERPRWASSAIIGASQMARAGLLVMLTAAALILVGIEALFR